MANPSDQATQDRNPIEDIVWYATHSVVDANVLRDMIYSIFEEETNSNPNNGPNPLPAS